MVKYFSVELQKYCFFAEISHLLEHFWQSRLWQRIENPTQFGT